MAITAIAKLTATDYVPESEKASDDPTIFKLKPLDGMQYLEVIAEMQQGGDGQSRLSGRGMQLAIKYGLTGWSNFMDEDGTPLRFNPLNATRIPPLLLSELVGEIFSRSELGEMERKNS